MAYTILNTDGTVLLLLADGQVDKSATSLTLIGKNYPSYGQDLNNNFIKLLANSASNSGSPPRSPLTGQLWYDTSIKRLKVYDNGFKTIGAVNVSTSQPVGLQTGDLWFDSSAQQLKMYSAGTVYTIGPSFPASVGLTGFVLPTATVTDQDSNSKNVVLLKSYGTTVGVMYYDDTDNKLPFEMNGADKAVQIPNASTSTVVSGLTIIGDLNVDGRITNNGLSISVDLDIIAPNPDNDAKGFGSARSYIAENVQNPAIADLLTKVFPPNSSTATSTATAVSGVLLGTEARVLVKYSKIDGGPGNGYQVRLFRTVGTHSTASWQAYYFTTATIAGVDNTAINYIS